MLIRPDLESTDTLTFTEVKVPSSFMLYLMQMKNQFSERPAPDSSLSVVFKEVVALLPHKRLLARAQYSFPAT